MVGAGAAAGRARNSESSGAAEAGVSFAIGLRGWLRGGVRAGSEPSEEAGFACGAGAKATVAVRTTFPLFHEESSLPRCETIEAKARVTTVTRAHAATIAFGCRSQLGKL